MIIELPDQLFSTSQLSEYELKLRIAIVLFVEDIFTLGQAAEFLGVPQLVFQQELGKRKIPVHYGVEELRKDLEYLNMT
ncbi:MAG: UPF0175 family protein [Saprospiraceae bacterium]|nr:UPF0175 family protein [Saprospiraceae bacterium]